MKKDIKVEILKAVKSINEKNPHYLIIGVLLTVLLLDYFLIMQFQLGALRTLGPRILQIKSDVTLYEQNKGRVAKYKETILDLDQKLASLQGRIKTTEDISAVLEGISRLANENQVFVEQVLPEINLDDPVLKNDQGRYFLLPIRVAARGGYHQFGRFLNDLEERGTLMRIDHLRIAADPQQSRQHLINMILEAVVFEPASGAGK